MIVEVEHGDIWRMNRMRLTVTLITILILAACISAQEKNEPEFIGEAYSLKADGKSAQLDKEIGDFTSGISWSHNSFNALSLEVAGAKSKARFVSGEPLQFVVRAVDNSSDPLTIITVFKFKSNKKSRSVLISKDNSGTFLKSRTNSKDMVRFSGKKYGVSSYLIGLKDLAAGEYGIAVSNPNNRDEKKVVVSCFAVD